MELHAVVAALLVGHAGDRAARRRGHQLEAGRQRGDLVAVAHPDLEHAVAFARREVLDRLEQPRVAARPHLGIAELAVRARLDLAAELHRHREHAVADAEHRHAELQHRLRRAQLVLLVGRGVAARQDDPLRRELADEGVADVVRVDLAEDVRLAHAARDQLRDLRAEVEDQDLVVHGVRWCAVAAAATRARRAALKWSQARTSAASLQQRAEVERRADAPVAARQVRDDAEQRRADDRRDDRHQAVQRAHRAHRAALRRRVGGARDDALDRRRDGEAEHVAEDHRVHHPALGRQRPSRGRRASTTPGRRSASRCGEKRFSSRPSSTPCTSADITPTANSDQPFSLRPPAELEGRVEHPASCRA